MPEKLRFDIYERLSPETLEVAEGLMTRIVELQRRWTEEGDVEVYDAWRRALSEMDALVGPEQEALRDDLSS